jgi:hypothetical protein
VHPGLHVHFPLKEEGLFDLGRSLDAVFGFSVMLQIPAGAE